uniref:Uncharacterized protein n=1 Tax=Eucampia antarctica TaxID=49252 RepID=A0A7S2S5E0_9STRA|mmetsp:Transcript_31297/g.30141  ORF Transcript_31297/g.30141 Transcript_31297/m.30141 type:complete len:183 (+) Transcript_31297:66-614(+)|eukprot:CAMPEP_0197823662 /NCGR_PEP_ID=MMETSP1437-20131217/993_1 /TAXON_ID=49252 ORGANISM="Eucampia antarctica, Strain CCMP1452" /NCGR_SAMPLE_ID=MMETSP1437 /ASSEMBLY_ACC=CAM_ASM_001096 /LENGTH=182 /DNA_ID=CAMNT_0043422945 /DNA_START=54 /DNA_END=602 /DNA_ORIENTATION=+
MSRAFLPPESLSKEDIRVIADVRRDVWKSGMSGLLIGAVSGYFIHSVSKIIYSRLSDASKLKLTIPGENPIRFTRNTAFLSVMLGSSLTSFAFASAAGKNRAHKLHPIYEIGKDKTAGMSAYQAQLAKSQDDGLGPVDERMKRIISRRKTMKARIEEGQALSDSHGGRWVQDVNSDEEQITK